MLYTEARDRIRSGDVLAWTFFGWRSWADLQRMAIRIGTMSEYEHVGVAWVIGGRVFVLEAVTTGVRIFPLSRLLPCFRVAVGRWSPDAEAFALAHLGERYSKPQAVAAFFHMLTPGVDVKWQCAEYVQQILTRAGIDVGDVLTPAAVISALLAQGFTLSEIRP